MCVISYKKVSKSTPIINKDKALSIIKGTFPGVKPNANANLIRIAFCFVQEYGLHRPFETNHTNVLIFGYASRVDLSDT